MTDLLLYLAIFFSPMGAKAFSFSVGNMKLSLFRLFIILSIMILIGNSLKNHQGIITSRLGNRYSVRFFTFWFLYATISVVWARDYSNWVRNLFFLFIGLCCIVLFINRFDSEKKILNAFKALNFGIIIQSFIGWYEVITLDYRFIEMTDKIRDYYIHGKLRTPIAMAGNQNDFATMMMFGAFIGYMCFATTNNKIWKVLYGTFAISEIVLLLLSTSRANILGFLIAIMLILFIGGRRKIIIIVAAIAILIAWPEIISNIFKQFSVGIINIESGSDMARINLIRNGFVFLGNTFGFGVGCGQIESWMLEKAIYPTGGIINIHNWWMEILTGYGVAVFIGYIVFYIKLLKTFFRSWLYSERIVTKRITMVITSLIVGFIIASISSSSNMTNEFLWVFWAVCVAYQGVLNQTGTRTGSEEIASRR